MAAADISRWSTDLRKRYKGVHLQQGRVIYEDDINEQERILREDIRKAREDIIGSSGSPDNGFRIENINDSRGFIDFDILNGSFYLGGNRLELSDPNDENNQNYNETFLNQSDSLQLKWNNHAFPNEERFDVVLLEHWLQPVSAVEDGELREVAFQGVDTSVRLKAMRRIILREDVGSLECAEAWRNLWLSSKYGKPGANGELIPGTTLTIDYEDNGQGEDLCSIRTQGGYLGAENQAIRVELVDDNSFTWGFDNASPIYRVKVRTDLSGQRKVIKFITQPKDSYLRPKAGQTVEILPWSAVLPNGEKVAHTAGHLTGVQSSYQANEKTITITSPVPENFNQTWSDGDVDEFYLRLWARGSDLSSDPAIGYTLGTPVNLGNTGLKIIIAGDARIPGDYWIIAARPESPREVVPWRLANGAPPHGYRRYYTPLALIHWQLDESGNISSEVRDCRQTFRPLVHRRTCCDLIIGDGVNTRGDFNSVQKGLDHLPPDGGSLCLLPGVHRVEAVLRGKKNIRISGCEGKTQILPEVSNVEGTIFHIVDSETITVENLDIKTFGGTAFRLEELEEGSLRDIRIRNNRMVVYKNAIEVAGGERVVVLGNRIRVLDREGAGEGIVIRAGDSIVEDNEIVVVPAEESPKPEDPGDDKPPDPVDPCEEPAVFLAFVPYIVTYAYFLFSLFPLVTAKRPYCALGGIRIKGASDDVVIRGNRIEGGGGNGVTLDSGRLTEPGEPPPKKEIFLTKYNDIWVRDENKKPLKGVVFAFFFIEDAPQMATTEEDGRIMDIDGHGDYVKIAVWSPGYTIKAIQREEIDPSHFEHKIILGEIDETVSTEKEGDFGVISSISIERNQIHGMGLSGIGIPAEPYFLTELLAAWGQMKISPAKRPPILSIFPSFITGLDVVDNLIARCGRDPLTSELYENARYPGLGGITLGWCEQVVVRDNRIEGNGENNTIPAHGILIVGSTAEIEGNRIIRNGMSIQDGDAELKRGLWGGIILVSATVSMVSAVSRYLGTAEKVQVQDIIVDDLPAGRIQNNVVHQPIGPALQVVALGPVSIQDNSFNTEYWHPGVLGIFGSSGVGTVFVMDIGVTLGSFSATLAASGLKASGNAYAERRVEAPDLSDIGPIIRWFPAGNVLFNGCQLRLQTANGCLCSNAIFTFDDVGYVGNQSDMISCDQSTLGNTFLMARSTLRAYGSRFKEGIRKVFDGSFAVATPETIVFERYIGVKDKKEDPVAAFPFFSLLTSARVNNTSNNQGDHCILVVPDSGQHDGRSIDHNNQVLYSRQCSALSEFLGREEGIAMEIEDIKMRGAYYLAGDERWTS